MPLRDIGSLNKTRERYIGDKNGLGNLNTIFGVFLRFCDTISYYICKDIQGELAVISHARSWVKLQKKNLYGWIVTQISCISTHMGVI